MTAKTDGAAARRSGARASGQRAARVAAVEQPSRADRAARGKDARAVAPLDSHAEFRAGRSRDPVGLLLGQAASQFTLVQMARKVVGVGSVGTRAWIVPMDACDSDEPLFLQAKEAQPCVLAEYAGRFPGACAWEAGTGHE